MNDKNIREPRTERDYHFQMSEATADKLYVSILKKMMVEKRYRDSGYTAGRLAEELGTSPRYVSAVVARYTKDNYSALVRSYRLRDACHMLGQARYAKYTMEEIGLMCGFNSRQSFYQAFKQAFQMSPLRYRRQLLSDTEGTTVAEHAVAPASH